MAEAAGLALGVAGLASLFTTCMECFDMLEMSRTAQKDIARQHQKLDNQKMRFVIWGRSLQLHEAVLDKHILDIVEADKVLMHNIQKTMLHIKSLFQDVDSLAQRYGLKKEPNPLNQLITSAPDGNAFQGAIRRFRARTNTLHTTGRKIRWVMTDRWQFQELVDGLRFFIDDLESMTNATWFAKQRRDMSYSEVEELVEDDLQMVIEAGPDEGGDELSDAASLRMTVLSRPSSDPGSNISSRGFSDGQSFFTASEGRASAASYSVLGQSMITTAPKERLLSIVDGHDCNVLEPNVPDKVHVSNPNNFHGCTYVPRSARNRKISKPQSFLNEPIMTTHRPCLLYHDVGGPAQRYVVRTVRLGRF